MMERSGRDPESATAKALGMQTEGGKYLFVVVRIVPLPSIPAENQATGDGMLGYLPVFEDRDLAAAWAQEHSDGPIQFALVHLWLSAADFAAAQR